MRSEKRRHPRTVLKSGGTIHWDREDGQTMYQRVKVLDLSESGARLMSPLRLDLRQRLNLQIEQPMIQATATVRTCRNQGLNFVLGVEFTALQNVTGQDKRVARWS